MSRCLSVRGRVRPGGSLAAAYAGWEPCSQCFCLHLCEFPGSCRGLYVAVRGISRTDADAHVHIADSVPCVSITRCRLHRSVAVWRCRQERTVNRRLSLRWFEPNTCHTSPQVKAGDAGLRHRFLRTKGSGYADRRLCPVGYAWAGSGCRPASGRVRPRCLLNCGNAHKSGCLNVALPRLPGRARVGYARDFGLVRVQIAGRSREVPTVCITARFHAS